MARRSWFTFRRANWRRIILLLAAGILVSGIPKGIMRGANDPPLPASILWSVPVAHAPGAPYQCPTALAPDHFDGCGPAPLASSGATTEPGSHQIVLYYDIQCRTGTSSTGTHLQADEWVPDTAGRYVKSGRMVTITKCLGAISS